jgi:hypothetical protein
MIVEPDTADYLAARLRNVTDELRAAHREIRRLRLRLALATSKVTPWMVREGEAKVPLAVLYAHNAMTIRLGDGTPEQEQP